jgi:hypothetical protein
MKQESDVLLIVFNKLLVQKISQVIRRQKTDESIVDDIRMTCGSCWGQSTELTRGSEMNEIAVVRSKRTEKQRWSTKTRSKTIKRMMERKEVLCVLYACVSHLPILLQTYINRTGIRETRISLSRGRLRLTVWLAVRLNVYRIRSWSTDYCTAPNNTI